MAGATASLWGCDRLQRVSETGLHRAGNLRNRIQERAVIKREILWNSIVFVCLFGFLLFLTSARPILPPPPPLTSSCAAQEPGEESLGSGGQRERAGLRPAGGSRLPSRLPGREQRSARSACASRQASAVPAARPPLPPAPPVPARPLRGQQVAKGSGDGTPRSTAHPASSGGKGGSWSQPLAPHSRPPRRRHRQLLHQSYRTFFLYAHAYKNINALYII